MIKWIKISVGIIFFILFVIILIPNFIEQKPSEFEIAVISNDVDKIKMLLKNGANVDLNYGLIRACAGSGHEDVARLLLENGANVNSSTGNGSTPLFWAARFGHYNIAKLLIKYGADINQHEKSKVTPLHQAVQYKHFDIVKLLIQNEVEPNKIDWAGKTALDYAGEENGLIEILRTHGAKYAYEL